MAKGRKTGGRQKGARNIASEGVKQILGSIYTAEAQTKEWKRWAKHKDPRLAFETFKLALSYLYGKPVQKIVGEEEAVPIKIDVSAIPSYREPAD
jgi:hypothetical protein